MLQAKRASNRILFNTGAQYIRSVINIIISLYSARLILSALGVNDYGIYSLIAGIVSLLSVLSNSLVITTQRFISFHQTRSPIEVLKKVFSNSLLIHLVLAVVIALMLEAIGPLLFNGFLNISIERIPAAKIVYQCVVIMVLISLISSPFRALLIAHENIVYTSIVEVINCFIKLGIAIWLTFHGEEKLILYATLLLLVSIFEMLAFIIFDSHHYTECNYPKREFIDTPIIKSMFGFAGWTLWSQACIIGRIQGVAIVVNKFFGTAVNAAYGIGIQVNGAVSFISASISNAFAPQIVKAAGENNPDKMFHLAALNCKYTFLLETAVVVPLFIYCPYILRLWLGEVPEYAALFCRIILLTSLADLLTMGLGTANQALGDIKSYSLYLNSLKLLTIPLIILLLLCGIRLAIVMWIYPAIELLVALIRLPFLRAKIGLHVGKFIKTVFKPVMLPFAICISLYYIGTSIVDNFLILCMSIVITTLIYGLVIYKFSLSKGEKEKTNTILRRILKQKY